MQCLSEIAKVAWKGRVSFDNNFSAKSFFFQKISLHPEGIYRCNPALSTSAVTITGAVSAVHWGPRQGNEGNIAVMN